MLSLKDEEVLTLTRWALAIETHYSMAAGRPLPMDIEWAKDGRTGELYIVQARPETVHALRAPQLELFTLKGQGEVRVHGKSVGSKIGTGTVRVIRSAAELPTFRPGEVLVAPMTDPDWEPVLRKAAAVVRMDPRTFDRRVRPYVPDHGLGGTPKFKASDILAYVAAAAKPTAATPGPRKPARRLRRTRRRRSVP